MESNGDITVSRSPDQEKTFIGIGLLKARVIESSGTPADFMLRYLSLCLTERSMISLTWVLVRSFEKGGFLFNFALLLKSGCRSFDRCSATASSAYPCIFEFSVV